MEKRRHSRNLASSPELKFSVITTPWSKGFFSGYPIQELEKGRKVWDSLKSNRKRRSPLLGVYRSSDQRPGRPSMRHHGAHSAGSILPLLKNSSGLLRANGLRECRTRQKLSGKQNHGSGVSLLVQSESLNLRFLGTEGVRSISQFSHSSKTPLIKGYSISEYLKATETSLNSKSVHSFSVYDLL